MMRRKSTIWLVAIAQLLMAGTFASTDVEPHGQHAPAVPMKAETIDVDHDGFISEGEHDAWAAQVFHTMDRDNNGLLTRHEYMAVKMGPGPSSGWSHGRMSMAQTNKSELFRAMDDDLNGTVGGVEFFRELDRDFRARDKNKDGRISIDELSEWHRGW